jgi:hypothetical protein
MKTYGPVVIGTGSAMNIVEAMKQGWVFQGLCAQGRME